jgi:hypothetical protein
MVIMDEAFSLFLWFVAPFCGGARQKPPEKFRGFSATEADRALNMPMMVVLGLLTILLVVIQVIEYVPLFVYTIF